MKRRIGLAIASAVLIGGVSAGLALATPPSGFVGVQFGRSTFSHFRVNQATEADIVVAENSVAPLGYSGWHSHPGKVVIGVQRGSITLYRSDPSCTATTYTEGQVFTEVPRFSYNAVNPSTTIAAVVNATYFSVPVGASVRIDQPQPPQCPA